MTYRRTHKKIDCSGSTLTERAVAFMAVLKKIVKDLKRCNRNPEGEAPQRRFARCCLHTVHLMSHSKFSTAVPWVIQSQIAPPMFQDVSVRSRNYGHNTQRGWFYFIYFFHPFKKTLSSLSLRSKKKASIYLAFIWWWSTFNHFLFFVLFCWSLILERLAFSCVHSFTPRWSSQPNILGNYHRCFSHLCFFFFFFFF